MAKGQKDLAGQARPDDFGVPILFSPICALPKLDAFYLRPLDGASQPANQ